MAAALAPSALPPVGIRVDGPLAALPTPWAHLVAQALGLILFATGLARLCPVAAAPHLLLASLPAACVCLASGQTGLLAAGLVAHATALGLERRGASAGVVAALATFKPQSALGPAIAALACRDRRWLAALALSVLGLALATVPAFGLAPWASFTRATSRTLALLHDGSLPASRMTTVLASAVDARLPWPVPLVLHLAVLVAVAACSALAWARAGTRRGATTMALSVALFVTPYAYDYDLPSVMVVAALAAPFVVGAVGPAPALASLVGLVAVQVLGVLLWSAEGRAFDGLVLWVFALFAAWCVAATRSPPDAPAVCSCNS